MEKNHMNFIFLSGDMNALRDCGDRRYMMIEPAKNRLPQGFYAAAADEIQRGTSSEKIMNSQISILGSRHAPTVGQAIEKSVQRLASLARLHALVMDDSHAITAQSIGQYRNLIATAIAEEIRK